MGGLYGVSSIQKVTIIEGVLLGCLLIQGALKVKRVWKSVRGTEKGQCILVRLKHPFWPVEVYPRLEALLDM